MIDAPVPLAELSPSSPDTDHMPPPSTSSIVKFPPTDTSSCYLALPSPPDPQLSLVNPLTDHVLPPPTLPTISTSPPIDFPPNFPATSIAPHEKDFEELLLESGVIVKEEVVEVAELEDDGTYSPFSIPSQLLSDFVDLAPTHNFQLDGDSDMEVASELVPSPRPGLPSKGRDLGDLVEKRTGRLN